MSIKLHNDTANGTAIIKASDTTGDVTITTPEFSAGMGVRPVLMTAQATTSGTFKDFIEIPSWAKKITVVFSGVSTNGTSNLLVQCGTTGGIENAGYKSLSTYIVTNGVTTAEITSGFVMATSFAADEKSGSMSLFNLDSNLWVSNHVSKISTATSFGGGNKALSGTLDRIRITTVNGTDLFDAGLVNVMVEG